MGGAESPFRIVGSDPLLSRSDGPSQRIVGSDPLLSRSDGPSDWWGAHRRMVGVRPLVSPRVTSGGKAIMGSDLSPFTGQSNYGVRPLTLHPPTLAAMFVFSPDMSSVPVEINRLDNQMLVRYYEEEWKRWS